MLGDTAPSKGAGLLTVIGAEPDLVPSWVDVAVTLAVPAPLGINTPEVEIVPPVADQVTPVLNAPVPCTVAEQVDVCVVRMELEEQETDTEVIVGDVGGVLFALPPPPPQPATHNEQKTESLNNVLHVIRASSSQLVRGSRNGAILAQVNLSTVNSMSFGHRHAHNCLTVHIQNPTSAQNK